MKPTPEIYVLVHHIRSLYNVGSLFRTCDGVGIKKLYLTGITGQPPRKEITKTALGADESVPWEYHWEPSFFLKQLKEQQIPIIAVERHDTSQPFFEVQYPSPLCLIFGNEVTGVEPELLSFADQVVHVPMYGIKESLNVAVCAGVVLYGVRWLLELG